MRNRSPAFRCASYGLRWLRLKANGKAGKSYVCAAMRKIIHIAFAILKSGKPFDPEYKAA